MSSRLAYDFADKVTPSVARMESFHPVYKPATQKLASWERPKSCDSQVGIEKGKHKYFQKHPVALVPMAGL